MLYRSSQLAGGRGKAARPHRGRECLQCFEVSHSIPNGYSETQRAAILSRYVSDYLRRIEQRRIEMTVAILGQGNMGGGLAKRLAGNANLVLGAREPKAGEVS